ncbi:MAG: fatty acid desaturase CarF family protein [Solirubrobacteraceae bacterium]
MLGLIAHDTLAPQVYMVYADGIMPRDRSLPDPAPHGSYLPIDDTGALPTIPGPWGEPPSVEDVKPLTPVGLGIHAAGAALNLAGSAAALAFLARNRAVVKDARLISLAGFAAGTYIADLASGVLHWTFDTWFDQGVEPLKRMVYIVREHHMRPARIFRYRMRDEAGLLSWFGLALASPFYLSLRDTRSDITPRRCAAAVTGLTIAAQVTFMLEFHKWGHRKRRGAFPRILQRSYLLLSPEAHLQHHSGNHDKNYCLINGVADRTLGRMGLFRGLEHLVTSITGAQPRRDDLQWARHYGRPR